MQPLSPMNVPVNIAVVIWYAHSIHRRKSRCHAARQRDAMAQYGRQRWSRILGLDVRYAVAYAGPAVMTNGDDGSSDGHCCK